VCLKNPRQALAGSVAYQSVEVHGMARCAKQQNTMEDRKAERLGVTGSVNILRQN